MANYGIGVEDEINRLSLGQSHDQPPPPPPPNMTSNGLVSVDITDKFSQAVKALSPGDVVKDGFFTLFESVAALEIMDPKMDSGCVAPGEDFEELYDVSRPLLPEDVLGIIDELLCLELSWHLGYPLSQTLFTSVYVEALLMPKPSSLDQARFVRGPDTNAAQPPMMEILRAYCLGALKACGYVNERIKAEHYYEEEDFVTNTYHRDLLDEISTDAIRDTLSEAMKILETQRGTVDNDLLDGLSARLDLRRIFLAATECPQHMSNPDVAREPWEKGLAILPKIKATHKLGKPVEEAFSTKLQRKLASTMPPRPIAKIDFDDAFGHLTRLFTDGSELIDVLHYTDSQCLQTFVATFQAKKPQPLIYIRTLLQTFLFDAMEVLGSMSIRQIMDDDLSIISAPASPLFDRSYDEIEVLTDPRFAIAQQMELFRQRAAQPFLDILRTSCQNRCRVRRTLCHMIRAWDNLQFDAEEADRSLAMKMEEAARLEQIGSSTSGNASDPEALPLASWAYLYKLKQMEEIVKMGFELEVYQPDELAGMYWYLNYLAKYRLQHVERINSFVSRAVEETTAGSRQALPGAQKQLQKSMSFSRLSMLDAAVTWELSDALSCLYTVLARLNLLKEPPRPYSNDRLRYELRMKPFTSVGLPELPSFEDFTANVVQDGTSSEDLLEYAERAVAGAKKGFEAISRLGPEDSFSVGSYQRWSASVKNQLKSCIATGIATAAVRKALQQRGEAGEAKIKAEVPTPDKAYHFWWIIPSIVPNK